MRSRYWTGRIGYVSCDDATSRSKGAMHGNRDRWIHEERETDEKNVNIYLVLCCLTVINRIFERSTEDVKIFREECVLHVIELLILCASFQKMLIIRFYYCKCDY